MIYLMYKIEWRVLKVSNFKIKYTKYMVAIFIIIITFFCFFIINPKSSVAINQDLIIVTRMC